MTGNWPYLEISDAMMVLLHGRYLPYHDVHEPYQAESRFRDPALNDTGRQTMQAMVACVSEGTGNVTRALKKAGMWDTTLFLWSSDNVRCCGPGDGVERSGSFWEIR
jgi:arylsulfatase A-like enzyme